MATNPWDAFPAVQQAGPVYGAPDPGEARANRTEDRQIAQFGLDQQRFAYQQQQDALAAQAKADEAAQKAQKFEQGQKNSIATLVDTINKIDQVGNQARAGWFDTGASGAVVRKYGPAGTDAYDLQANLGKIDATGAFSTLQAMRDASPTGAALGAVSDTELGLLKSSVANLDPNQSEGQFLTNLVEARNVYLRMLERLDPEAAKALREQQASAPPPINDENGLEVTVTDTSPAGGNAPPPAGGAPSGGGFWDAQSQGLGSIVEGVASIPALAVDPIATTLGRALGYENYTSDFARQLRSDLGLQENRDPVSSAVIRGGAGALSGGLLARGVAGVLGSGPVRNAFAAFGATPGRDIAAGAGSGLGGEIGDRLGGTSGRVIGTLAGGVGGYTAANSAARRWAGQRVPNALMGQADSIGVEMMPADVGGTGTRMASAVTRMTLGGIPMAEAAERSVGTAQAARNRIASDIGAAVDDAGAGQAVRRGFSSFEKSSEARAAKLYNDVSVPGESQVQLSNTRQALGEVTRGMQSNPELSRLWANHPRLRSTLEALTPEDNRAAGQVQYSQATDKLRGAEEALAQAKQTAGTNLSFEQAQARDAAESARSQYDSLLSSARNDAAQAEQAASAMSAQRSLDPRAAQLRRAADAANARYTAIAQRDANLPEVAGALKAIDDADAAFNAVRYQEPRGNALSSAQKAVDDAKAEVDQAFIASRQAPQGGELSWDDMKRFRSIVGEIVGQPGVAADGSDVAGLRKLYAALTTDMEVSAAQAGPKALQEFRRANQYWRGRQDRIDDVFAGLFGNRDQRSDEAVSRTLNQWAQRGTGDFSRLSRTIRSLPEDEANTVRATIIQRMGEATPANGGSAVFTPDVFATQWKSLSDRAKNVLFPNKQHRQDLEALGNVAEAMKRAGEYRNTSKTSLATNATAQGILALTNLPAAVMLAGGQFGLGKLLASPRFARALASTRRMPEDQAARKLSDQLTTIAIREPALRSDAKALQDYLSQSFGASPTRAAAQDEPDRRREPVQ